MPGIFLRGDPVNISQSNRNLLIAGIAVAVAVMAFIADPARMAKPGLYQYVRRAEKYIEEKKFDRAIRYLYRAFDTAPESEALKLELVRGYLEYAAYLFSRGDVAGAIRKTAYAYEVMPESVPVVNNLAYYISVRGVQKSVEGDSPSAGEDIKIALMLAETSEKTRKNIANYFFNRALDAMDRKDRTTLSMCLDASYELDPRPETLFLSGLSFYEQRNLEKALSIWNEALSMRPEDDRVREKIERVEKEISLGHKRSGHTFFDLEIILYLDHKIDWQDLEIHLAEVYSTVGQDLGYYPHEGTGIIMYDEKDFRDIFQKDGMLRGFYDGNIRIAVSGPWQDALKTGILAHEYTHAVLSALTENRCPIWLHEGIAVYQQARYMDISLGELADKVRRGEVLSISGIDGYFSRTDDHTLVSLAYQGAYSAVIFIIDEWGWSGLRRLLAGIREQGHFANALDEKFYISVPTFERMWNDFLRKKFAS